MSKAPFDLVAVSDQTTRHAAESLIREYLKYINDSAFQNYHLSFDVEAMIASDIEDPSKFYPPTGRFYLVRHADQFVGVGCLKRLEPTVAEIQRMYVQPKVRGLGAGRLLVDTRLTLIAADGARPLLNSAVGLTRCQANLQPV